MMGGLPLITFDLNTRDVDRRDMSEIAVPQVPEERLVPLCAILLHGLEDVQEARDNLSKNWDVLQLLQRL